MTVEQRIYETTKLMDWLIDGYFTNMMLQNFAGKGIITPEWVVEHFNVEMSYFRPHLFKVPVAQFKGKMQTLSDWGARRIQELIQERLRSKEIDPARPYVISFFQDGTDFRNNKVTVTITQER